LKLRDRLLDLHAAVTDGDQRLVLGHEVFSSWGTNPNCQVIYLDMIPCNLCANPGKNLYSPSNARIRGGLAAFVTGGVSE
jgi:hypothetical protein